MDFKVALQLLLYLFVFLLVIVILSIIDRENKEGCPLEDNYFLSGGPGKPAEIYEIADRPVTLASEALDAIVTFSGYFEYPDGPDYYYRLPFKLQLVNLNDILQQKLLTLSTFCSKIALTISKDNGRRKVDSIHVRLALSKGPKDKVCHIEPKEVIWSELEAHFACNRKLQFDCKIRNASDGSLGTSMGTLVFENLEFQVEDVDKTLARRKEFSTPSHFCYTGKS